MIAISSGHGLYVAGASGFINEVEEARKVVDKVTDLLQNSGVTVHKFHDNTSRNQRDNINRIVRFHNSKNRSLDVSVHFNAFKKTDGPMGVEVLYYSESGRKVAEKVASAISKASGLKNRGAKRRTNLGFLKDTNKTAILIEVCFVDSKVDVNIYRNKFDAICKAIAESITGKKVATFTPKNKVVNFYTGGYRGQGLAKIHDFLLNNNFWYKPMRLSDGSMAFLIGGFTVGGPTYHKMKKFLEDNKFWYEIRQ